MTRGRASVVPLVAVALLVVTSCADPSSPVPSVGPPGPGSADEAGAQAQTSPASPTGDLPPARWSVDLPGSPFGPWLSFAAVVNERSTLDAEAQAAWWDRTQELTAQCMTVEGFEYVPIELPLHAGWGLSTVDALPVPWLPGTRAEVERVGYGVDDIEAMEAQLAGEGALDVNDAYAESLGEAGQAAYYLALIGFDGSGQSADGGCVGRAQDQVPRPGADDPSAGYLEQYVPLLVEMASFARDVVLWDPRTIALNEEWAACMAEAGYDLPPSDGLPGPYSAADAAVRTRPDGTVADPAPDTLTSEIPFDERYLTGDPAERPIALADFDCRATTDYLARLTAIQVDLEDAFVTARADALDEMAAALSLGAP